METAWKASPSDRALVAFGFSLGEGVFKTLGTSILDFLKWNNSAQTKTPFWLGPRTGTRLHCPFVSQLCSPTQESTRIKSICPRSSHPHQAWPDTTIPGSFSEKQDKSINPTSCTSRLCNQPDLRELTWARRDPSWQLCPSSHCSRQLSAPWPCFREGNQTRCLCSEQGSSHGNWKFCVNSHQTHRGAVSSRRIHYILIREQLDISLASTH